MCMPSAPEAPPPPAQRQPLKEPEIKSRNGDPMRRRRGYAALMRVAQPSLQPPATTATLGG